MRPVCVVTWNSCAQRVIRGREHAPGLMKLNSWNTDGVVQGGRQEKERKSTVRPHLVFSTHPRELTTSVARYPCQTRDDPFSLLPDPQHSLLSVFLLLQVGRLIGWLAGARPRVAGDLTRHNKLTARRASLWARDVTCEGGRVQPLVVVALWPTLSSGVGRRTADWKRDVKTRCRKYFSSFLLSENLALTCFISFR